MIKKIVILFILFISCISVYAEDSKILALEVNGTQRIDIETVISYSKVEIGDSYNEDLKIKY